MRDLPKARKRNQLPRETPAPCSGSLPQDQHESRPPVREVQSRDRENRERPELGAESSSLPAPSLIQVIRTDRRCPPAYADFLVRIGGRNPFGEPNFRLIWGETATKKIWGQKTNGYCGQHVQLAYGVSGWILEEWKPPECMGVTPEQWYEQSWQPDAQLHILGDFPFRGYYSPCIHLYAQHWEGEKLITEPQELNYNVLTMLVPAIFQARAMTFRQKQTFIRRQMEREQREANRVAKDAYLDAGPAFGGNDFDRSVNRERMIRSMSRVADARTAAAVIARMGRGHKQLVN